MQFGGEMKNESDEDDPELEMTMEGHFVRPNESKKHHRCIKRNLEREDGRNGLSTGLMEFIDQVKDPLVFTLGPITKLR